MRMIGSVIGARVMVATRRSVIFNSDGLDWVFTFWGYASRVSSAQKLAPPSPASPFKKPRRCARVSVIQVLSLPIRVRVLPVRNRAVGPVVNNPVRDWLRYLGNHLQPAEIYFYAQAGPLVRPDLAVAKFQ